MGALILCRSFLAPAERAAPRVAGQSNKNKHFVKPAPCGGRMFLRRARVKQNRVCCSAGRHTAALVRLCAGCAAGSVVALCPAAQRPPSARCAAGDAIRSGVSAPYPAPGSAGWNQHSLAPTRGSCSAPVLLGGALLRVHAGGREQSTSVRDLDSLHLTNICSNVIIQTSTMHQSLNWWMGVVWIQEKHPLRGCFLYLDNIRNNSQICSYEKRCFLKSFQSETPGFPKKNRGCGNKMTDIHLRKTSGCGTIILREQF